MYTPCTGVFPCQKVCFLVVLTCFSSKHIQYKGVYGMLSAASSLDDNGGRDHIIGISLDEQFSTV